MVNSGTKGVYALGSRHRRRSRHLCALIFRSQNETGIEVLVPPYLTTGETIKVDTRDGRFVERVKQ